MTAFPTPADCIREAVSAFEGGFQDMPEDRGNWVPLPGTQRRTISTRLIRQYTDGTAGQRAAVLERYRLVGTMRGVTPGALADYLGVEPHTISVARIKAVTLEEATEIGLQLFYHRPNLDRLLWSPMTEVLLDIAWGSGPARAIMMAQQLVGGGIKIDGAIANEPRPSETVEAVNEFLDATPMDQAVERLYSLREAYYRSISRPGTPNAKFRAGWCRRARWYRPANAEWWGRWRDPEALVQPESLARDARHDRAAPPSALSEPVLEPKPAETAEGTRQPDILRALNGGLGGVAALALALALDQPVEQAALLVGVAAPVAAAIIPKDIAGYVVEIDRHVMGLARLFRAAQQ